MDAPQTWILPDQRHVVTTGVTGGFTAQLYDSEGRAEGPQFSAVEPAFGLFTAKSVTPLATGGYVVGYTYAGALLPSFLIESTAFTADGQALTTSTVSIPADEAGNFPRAPAMFFALPDGGFVAQWVDGQPFNAGGEQVAIREFDADGAPVSKTLLLGTLATGSPTLQVQPDGHYTVSWQSPTGPQQQTFLEHSPPLADSAFHAAPAQTLSASQGWTAAAVLSNHALAIADVRDGGWGSHVAGCTTYAGSADPSADASLMGYAAAGQSLTPQVHALAYGGFYQVTYAGSTDVEVYDPSGQLVFVQNRYTASGAGFTALAGGGYLVTDFNNQVMALHDAAGHVGWIGLQGLTAPQTIAAAADGGFTFVYADHVTGFDAAGRQDFSYALGAAGSGFASAAAGLAGGEVAKVWLSAENGQATAIRFQTFGEDGASAALTVAQDSDPWHTSFALQAHGDGSATILWSQGGGVFGAEYAGGAVGEAHAALTGDLSSLQVIELSSGAAGFAYLQGGHVWAEIFDAGTGAVQRADLGAATGDLSTVHALATAAGGLAVSWHNGAGVNGAVLDASGRASAASSLAGDLIGVGADGRAITLHDLGGTPVMQTYALADGLFWVH